MYYCPSLLVARRLCLHYIILNIKKYFSQPLNTLSTGCISQVNNLRTLAANFRFTCLTLLKTLTLSSNLGVHFVRCIRADLEYKPQAFHSDMIQQQMKALGVLDTVVGRQRGYSCRITFQEFLRRFVYVHLILSNDEKRILVGTIHLIINTL